MCNVDPKLLICLIESLNYLKIFNGMIVFEFE